MVHRIWVSTSAVWLVAAACVSMEKGDSDRAGAAFELAFEFMPRDMTSWWISDRRHDELGRVTVRCGRKFPPPGAIFGGDTRYEGVTAEDYTPGKVPEGRLLGWRRSDLIVMGYGVWNEQQEARDASNCLCWCAIVEERVLVMASSVQLLEEALQRKSRLSLEKLIGSVVNPDLVLDAAVSGQWVSENDVRASRALARKKGGETVLWGSGIEQQDAIDLNLGKRVQLRRVTDRSGLPVYVGNSDAGSTIEQLEALPTFLDIQMGMVFGVVPWI